MRRPAAVVCLIVVWTDCRQNGGASHPLRFGPESKPEMSNAASADRLQALLDEGAQEADQAYSALLAQASNRLLKLTRRMLRGYPQLRRWEETDDVFQSAALRLHRALSEVRPPSVAAFWGLAAIQIRRVLIDLARHHFGPEGAAAHHHSDGLAPPAHAHSGSARLAAVERASRDNRPETVQEWTELHEAIERLDPAQREVFDLVWYAGLPQAEIAGLVGVSLPTVQRRWYAAQLQLYELLGGEPPELERGI